jgi:hypothetical protein
MLGRYNAVDCRTFDTANPGNLFNELMIDWVSHLPDGTMVLVASKVMTHTD